MKNKFLRLVSLLLTIASLVSVLTVFAWAEEGEGSEIETPDLETEEVIEELTSVELLYERDFEEGWDVDNGLKITKNNHNMYVDFEELSDYSYNYFMRLEATKNAGAATAVIDFGTRVAREKATVISFSIKADDACSFAGPIMTFRTGGKRDFNLLYVKDHQVYAFAQTKDTYIGSLESNDWIDITFVLDWSDRTKYSASAYVGEDFDLANPVATTSSVYGSNSEGKPYEDSGVATFTMTLPATSTEDATKNQDGMSFCIDNLQAYQGITKPRTRDEIVSIGDGINIDPLVTKVIDIQSGSGVKTVEQLLEEALCLKLGVSYALFKDEKISIDNYCIPTKIDGNIVVSLQLILDFIGYPYYVHPDGESYDITTGLSSTYITVGRDTASADGELINLTMAPAYLEGTSTLVIAMEDIPEIFPGWLITYDDMGLIIMYEDTTSGESDGESLITREKDLDTMLTMMKRFVFETVTLDEEGNALTETDSYVATGNRIYGDVAANTEFAHPYIFANQEKFDSLYASFLSKEDEKLTGYFASLIAKADAVYNEYAIAGDEYTGILEGKEPVNEFFDGKRPTSPSDPIVDDTEDAYNGETGALYEIEAVTEKLVDLAFAYQVTREVKYAKLAYDMSLVIGEWLHWAPGYMINCATATANFAISYDWLYNVYVEFYGTEAVEALAQIIYEKGVMSAYASVTGQNCEYPRPSGTGDRYATRTDSWNAICSSGMIIGALAIMNNEEYKDVCTYVIGNNVQNLANYGLDQYAPDGSYIESTTYWAKGTNAFMKLIMALDSAAGNDYGFINTWGLESTFYYAIHIENSDGDDWNYHEDGVGSIVDSDVIGVDTQMFNYAAYVLSDANLAAIRDKQVANGKAVSIYDVLFYPGENDYTVPELELDYTLEGVDGFVSRSDWENGALYVGIMGGANYYSPYTDATSGDDQFGQIDSGNFIYQNNGTTWIMDLGSDNFSAYNYFGSYRFRYYRNSAEGNNVIFFTSRQTALPYGQDPNGAGKLESTYVDPNGNGSYAIIDNGGVYGTYVISAKRGMLLLNDRSTVVIQDEISMNNSFEDVCWVAHTAHKIYIDPQGDGRTAYLIYTDSNGIEQAYLRATLVSSSSSLKFEAVAADSPILKTTIKNDNSEFTREDVQRLVVRATGVLGLELAVVFEEVDDYLTDNTGCSYTWIDMRNWNNAFAGAEEDDGLRRRGKAVRSDIIDDVTAASMFIDDNETAFGKDLQKFYEALTNVAYTLKTYDSSTFGTEMSLHDAYEEYLDFCDEFTEYADFVNDSMDQVQDAMNVFAGL